MKRTIGRLPASLLLVAAVVLLTGCGGDDDGQAEANAPQSVQELRQSAYALSWEGGNAQLSFSDGARYTLADNEHVRTGTYSNPQFSANQVTMTLSPDSAEQDNPPGTLTLTFSQSNQGIVQFLASEGGLQRQGQFMVVSLGENPPGGTTSGETGGETAGSSPIGSGPPASTSIEGTWTDDPGMLAGRSITFGPLEFVGAGPIEGADYPQGVYIYDPSVGEPHQARLTLQYTGIHAGDSVEVLLGFGGQPQPVAVYSGHLTVRSQVQQIIGTLRKVE